MIILGLLSILKPFLKNADFNMKLNLEQKSPKKELFQRGHIMNLDWTAYKNFNLKFDFIIGSDIVYDGCPLDDLAGLISKALNKGGEAWIIIPNERFKASEFLAKFSKDEFALETQSLEGESDFYK